MPDGLDWLLYPVVRGLCKYESLVNGELDLGDIQILNDCIAVSDENEYRVIQSHKKQP